MKRYESRNTRRARKAAARDFAQRARIMRRQPVDTPVFRLRYILVPGYVCSRDGDRHHISAQMLAQLYDVDMCECVVANRLSQVHDDCLLSVLTPQADGRYAEHLAQAVSASAHRLIAETERRVLLGLYKYHGVPPPGMMPSSVQMPTA